MNLQQHIQEMILEATVTAMPQHYPEPISYQKDSKFVPISLANLKTYAVFSKAEGLIYAMHPGHQFGFVFSEEEIAAGGQHVIPVMRLALRDTAFGYKQAYRLRMRQSYARLNLATTWYLSYAERFGGIVSDREHLEGGRKLWEALLKIARNGQGYSVMLGDWPSGRMIGDATAQPLEEIWSSDARHIDRVLILLGAQKSNGHSQPPAKGL